MFSRKMLAEFLRVLRFRLQRGRISMGEFLRMKGEAYSLHSVGIDQRLDWGMRQFSHIRKVKARAA